ncbi:MAG TPA: phosphopantetheine adenylyltransferase, partial [Ilumatobacteraceae bacterium]|nr:phosphopantetheine adenylyltransferase [Ilumatobacteraceae bacterium]
MFAIDERLDMVRESLAHVGGVEVAASTGLAIDAARDLGADFMVKGLRNTTDFDIEQQMAHTNQSVGGVATVYLPCRPDQVFVSSRFIREIAQYGRDVSHLVPAPVQQRFALRFPPDQPPRDLP